MAKHQTSFKWVEWMCLKGEVRGTAMLVLNVVLIQNLKTNVARSSPRLADQDFARGASEFHLVLTLLPFHFGDQWSSKQSVLIRRTPITMFNT